MKISTKGLYALRMMIDLGEHREEGFVSLKEIAARQQISKKYLEQIIPLFNQSHLLLTNRGAQGGYQLARSPKEITVGEILRLTEGGLTPVSCAEENAAPCERSSICATRYIWRGLTKVINEYLDGITLQDVMDNHQAQYEISYDI